MSEDAPLLLLGTGHPTKGAYRLERAAANAWAATTAGDGPSTNPKLSPNEDSLAVVSLADGGVAALVADAHFGAGAGEIAARFFAESVRRTPPVGREALVALLVELDERIRAERPPGDRSETTALAAVVRRGRLDWASAADSRLFLRLRGGGLGLLSHTVHDFLGGPVHLASVRRDHPELLPRFVEGGAARLEAGDVVLLASDGIDEEYSGVSERRLEELLGGPRPLEERVALLMTTAGRAATGGGRDNLSVVAVEALPAS
ncbi:MAG: protein phosphatase 2C domain-containing protein [Planctomycetes bacterium]|nr:protein phosphatase 2C domain-containing protein [Planctomycetota bacterium]